MRLAEMESLILNIGISLFAIFAFFVIYDVAKKSNAGKAGTTLLFCVLGLGLAVFLIKAIIINLIGMNI